MLLGPVAFFLDNLITFFSESDADLNRVRDNNSAHEAWSDPLELGVGIAGAAALISGIVVLVASSTKVTVDTD